MKCNCFGTLIPQVYCQKTHLITLNLPSPAQKTQQNGEEAVPDKEKPTTEDKDGGNANNVVEEEGKEEESQGTEKDSEEPMET